MTLTEQVKILDDKIRASKAQFDLDREAAKILTGEDLGYKPDVIQRAKFEYSTLGQAFNKGSDVNEKKKDF